MDSAYFPIAVRNIKGDSVMIPVRKIHRPPVGRVHSVLQRTVVVISATALLLSAAIAGSPLALADGHAAVSLSNLEVENRQAPLGIDAGQPRFSWVLSADARGQIQKDYRIRVATTPDKLANGKADVWDSGTISSADSFGVAYSGPALAAGTRYYWRVEATTTSGGKSSSSSTFDTGLLSASDWGASSWIGRARVDASNGFNFSGSKWIWTPEAGAPYAPAEPRAFRKSIAAPAGKTLAKAEILMTADDLYLLWVNGSKIAETTGATNEWQGAKRYVVDLNDGTNVVAVQTNNGANSPAGLLAAIRVTYTDGSFDLIRTDASWKGSKTLAAGFETPGFDDSAWEPVAIQADYGSGPWGQGVNLPVMTDTTAPLTRKEFTVDSKIESAKMYVAAGGYANVSLNGAPINKEILSPGFTDYDKTAQYVVTDLTEQLKTGKNALGIELGRGFYGMTNSNVWQWQKAPWHDDPVARAVLRIVYKDGQTKDIVTDDSWSLNGGPTLLDDLYGGETYDARAVKTGFDTVGYQGEGWTAAVESTGPKGTLVNQSQQPIVEGESLPASSVTAQPDGSYVVGFPRVIAGNVAVTATGAAGTQITMKYGEKLKANGSVNQDNNGGFANGFQTDRFTLAGKGNPESWAAKFSYKGFQYIQVTGWPGSAAPTVNDFTARAVHSDVAKIGNFESSNALLNSIHKANVDTLLSNLHGIPTDTPMFEKNGWTGDGMLGAEMFMTNLDVQSLFAKWEGDIDATRINGEGAPMVIAPGTLPFGNWGPAGPWHSAYVLVPYWLYQYGGDQRVLEQYYDGMKSYVNFELSRSPGGISDTVLGDWVSPETSPGGGNAPEDKHIAGTAYLYYMLSVMQKIAGITGHNDDIAAFERDAATVKSAFNANFLDTAKGYYRGSGDQGYRQTHNLLALAFGLTPDAAMAQTVADSVAADVVSRGNKLNTGALGTKYILPMLTEYGHADLAYKVAVQTEFPSWGFWMANGATSMWEHWSVDARSHGHYFLGTIDDWLYKDVAGIATTDKGFRNFDINPRITADLEWAKANTESPFGTVRSEWHKTGSGLTLSATVPVGATATVTVPAENVWAITENGDSLDKVKGVSGVKQEGANVVLTLGSGNYAFEVGTNRGHVGASLAGLEKIATYADAQQSAGMLSEQQRKSLGVELEDVQRPAGDALNLAGQGKAEKAAELLSDALKASADLITWAADAQLSTAVRSELQKLVTELRNTLSESVSKLLGVVASAVVDKTGYKPGQSGTVTANVANQGGSLIQQVSATLPALDQSWAVNPAGGVSLGSTIPAGSSASGFLTFQVPAGQNQGPHETVLQVQYQFDGDTITVQRPLTIGVESPLSMSSVLVAPDTVAPGGTTQLTTILKNEGGQAVSGAVTVDTPPGWPTVPPSAQVTVPAGGEIAVTVPVAVPRDAAAGQVTVPLNASFMAGGENLAKGSVNLIVQISSDLSKSYDHADLGETASETAHTLTASASSGTSTEAGLTRRYAGHLTDYSSFEFDMKIVADQAFVIRSIETYDKAQSKRYKVYVNGVEAMLRVSSHTGGAGTETFEFVVPATLATSDSVRIKFENQADHSFYDPSIADVWTLPATP